MKRRDAMYDTIVVGARCAGSPLAMLLARRGAKVLLVDKATFPSEIPHGHFVHRHGPRQLRSWGLLAQLAATTPAVTSTVWDFGDFPLVANDLVEDGLPWGFGPRRSTLDKLLVDAAVASGVELRERFTVEDYLFDGETVAGVRGRGPDGSAVEERATITVGADGRNSRLARRVQAPMTRQCPTILCYYFSYWSGVPSGGFELYVRAAQQRIIFSFKTERDRFAVFIGLPIAELHDVRRDIEGEFQRTLDLAPELAARLREGQREERFYGASDLPNFFRKPYGDGWALVGDAGLHKDPFLALGICDAWRDAELLAGAIGDGVSGARPMPQALSEYEAARDAASTADYEENIALARFSPLPPWFFPLRAAVRDRPDEATRMIKARMGMIEPALFYSRENIQRLLGESAHSTDRSTEL